MNAHELPRALRSLKSRLDAARAKGDAEEQRRIKREIALWMSNQKDPRNIEAARRLLGEDVDHGTRPDRRMGARPGGPPTGRQPGGRGWQAPRPGRPEDARRGGSERSGPAPDHSAIASHAAVPPEKLGLPFHNPYTFIPFRQEPPRLGPPSLLTCDELPEGRERLTGVLDLEVTAESPLLTCDSTPAEEIPVRGAAGDDARSVHRVYRALAIGQDVIVPASGIRGSLRSLMTILSGGTLNNLRAETYLCQKRDLSLGPAPQGVDSPLPQRVFLGRVERPGTSRSEGVIRLGQTQLLPVGVIASAVARKGNFRFPEEPPRRRDERMQWERQCEDILAPYRRPFPRGERLFLRQIDPVGWEVAAEGAQNAWHVKLSMRPVDQEGKREGLFLADGPQISARPALWAAYLSRHLHSARPELREGDLVWLCPIDPSCTEIKSEADIASLQWSRWGKQGRSVVDLVKESAPGLVVDPDRTEVDRVTDMFGRVGGEDGMHSFASRILPENLVFEDAVSCVERTTLSPLMPPHAGCLPFYRWQGVPGVTDANAVSAGDPLRGYKVYRIPAEGERPWLWDEQPVWTEGHPETPKPKHQTVNRTVDLLPLGRKGRLRIAFRSLSPQELAFLLFACRQPWRLGGGKPFGLGLCSVKVLGLADEDGRPINGGGHGPDLVPGEVKERSEQWLAALRPVENLRYPRAVEGRQRGGQVWFSRHAALRLGDAGGGKGLQPRELDEPLAGQVGGRRLDGQPLPAFDPSDPASDRLYGYDGVARFTEGRPKHMKEFRPFDPTVDGAPGPPRGRAENLRAEDRRDERDRR